MNYLKYWDWYEICTCVYENLANCCMYALAKLCGYECKRILTKFLQVCLVSCSAFLVIRTNASGLPKSGQELCKIRTMGI